MDVSRWRILFLSLVWGLVLAGCSQKTSSSVFPENSSQSLSCEGQRIESRFIVQWEDGRRTVEEFSNSSQFISEFLEPHLPLVRHVEFDKAVYLSDLQTLDFVPMTTAVDVWGLQKVEAPQAWAQGFQGQNVKVAVIDSAVDYTHPQLSTRLSLNAAEVSGRTGVDDDNNGYIDDRFGWDFFDNKPVPTITSRNVHGTHVAGIIAADPNQGSLSGIAPAAQIVPANFMDQDGGGTLSAALDAIDYAAARGAKVINASWGGPGCSQALQERVARLYSQNILFVAASGNDGQDLDFNPDYPAAFNPAYQLTVASSRSSDFLSGFSNTSYNFVHLAAPGESILSTVPGGIAYLSGTSMAAPFVSGAAAVLWSAKPQATVQQVKEALLRSVDNRNYRVMTRGRLNLRRAVDEIRRLVP